MGRRLIVIGSIALFGIFVVWFLWTHERVTETRYSGYRGEARINDFLAATLLINEVGIEADSMDSLLPLKWLPDYEDTIFTRLSANLAVGDRLSALEAWVADGGHLIIMPPDQPSRLVDDALDRFGFGLIEVEPETNDEEDEPETPEDEESDEEYDYTVALGLVKDRIEIRHDIGESATLSDDLGVIAARRAYSGGYVTFVADAVFFENSQLDELDHGRLLLDVVYGYVGTNKVWLVYDASFTPLWKLIWDRAPYAIIGFSALLIVAMWAAMPMFGPSIPAAPPVRRSIIEHIRAAGTFVWKQHGGGGLGNEAAKAVLHRAEARHPGIARLAPDRQAKLIARLTGLDAQVVLDAILSGGEPHAREFTQHMEILQKIRKEL